jgi:ubiquinone/menaquinone biosynthesis C-methylase UbiE
MKQNQIFLNSEGDSWHSRNESALSRRKLPDDDLILQEILKINNNEKKINILEIGCGNGYRLEWLTNNINASCFGIEPSKQAVKIALKKGIHAIQGTAESLPFDRNSFDIIIFGFCLYLCDREDLFKIAAEADRVCKNPGWIIIQDFYSSNFSTNEYHHFNGMKSFKMNYRSLFTWHPFYECTSHKIIEHDNSIYNDNKNNWMALSTLRKNSFLL